MTTGRVVNLDNGHGGICVEALRGVTYCGETFDPEDHDLELFAVHRDEGHPHCMFCFECSKFDSRKLRTAVRQAAG